MTSVRPPSDFAARTSRVVGDAAIEPASARPVVWVVTAAAACLALAVGVRYFTSRPRPGRERSESEVVSRAPSRGSGLGRAYVISEDGRLIAYTGRASIRKIWNMKEGVFELIVDAFPGEGSR